MKRAIEDGTVSVNGRIVAKGGVVQEGDRIVLDETVGSGATAPCIPEPAAPLVVRHESAEAASSSTSPPVSRPRRCAGGETGTLANAIAGHHPELVGIGYSPREPGIVHRLDNETSGLVVVARTQGRLRDAP